MSIQAANQIEKDSLSCDIKEEEQSVSSNKETLEVRSAKDGELGNEDCSKAIVTDITINADAKVECTVECSVSEIGKVNPDNGSTLTIDNPDSPITTNSKSIVYGKIKDLTPTVQSPEKKSVGHVFSSDDLDEELTDILNRTDDNESGGGRKDQAKDIFYVKNSEMEACDVIKEGENGHVKNSDDKAKTETSKECTGSVKINSKKTSEDSQDIFKRDSKPAQAENLILEEIHVNSNGNKLKECDENLIRKEISTNSAIQSTECISNADPEVKVLEADIFKRDSKSALADNPTLEDVHVNSKGNKLKEYDKNSTKNEISPNSGGLQSTECISNTDPEVVLETVELKEERPKNSSDNLNTLDQSDDCVIVSESLVSHEIEGSEENFEIDDILDNIIHFDHSDNSSQNSSEFKINARMVSGSIREYFSQSGGSRQLTRQKLSCKAVLLNLPEGVSNKDLEKALLDVKIQNVDKLQIVVNKQKDRSFGVVTFTDKWSLDRAMENRQPILVNGVLLKLISCDPDQEENSCESSPLKLGRKSPPQGVAKVKVVPVEKLMSERFPTKFYKALASNFPLGSSAKDLTEILFIAGIKNINSLILKVLCKGSSCSVIINFTDKEQYDEVLRYPKCPFIFKGSGVLIHFEPYSEEDEEKKNDNDNDTFWDEVELKNIIDRNFIIGKKEELVSVDRFKAIIAKLPNRVSREDLEKTLISASCTINTPLEVIDISDSEEPFLSNQQVAKELPDKKIFDSSTDPVFTAVIRGIPRKSDISKRSVKIIISRLISPDVAEDIKYIHISTSNTLTDRFIRLGFTNYARYQEAVNKKIVILGTICTITPAVDEEMYSPIPNKPPRPAGLGLSGGNLTVEVTGKKRKYTMDKNEFCKQRKYNEQYQQTRSQNPHCPSGQSKSLKRSHQVICEHDPCYICLQLDNANAKHTRTGISSPECQEKRKGWNSRYKGQPLFQMGPKHI